MIKGGIKCKEKSEEGGPPHSPGCFFFAKGIDVAQTFFGLNFDGSGLIYKNFRLPVLLCTLATLLLLLLLQVLLLLLLHVESGHDCLLEAGCSLPVCAPPDEMKYSVH